MLELTQNNFEAEVLQETTLPVLVDFWSPGCRPCLMQTPVLEQFAKEHGSVIKVCKVNTDDNPDLAVRYGIMAIPTLLVFKNGVPVKKAVGIQNTDALKRLTAV